MCVLFFVYSQPYVCDSNVAAPVSSEAVGDIWVRRRYGGNAVGAKRPSNSSNYVADMA